MFSICITLFKFLYFFICYQLNIHSYTHFIKSIAILVSDINIYYVKIFQWQLLNSNFNSELTDFFRQFNNNVKYSEKDIDIDALNNMIEYAKQTNNILTIENNYRPINSGTIALVFKGKLNDKEIVIKMLRYNIQTEIEKCLDNTIYLLNIIKYLNIGFNTTSASNYMTNIRKCLYDQCDFLKEVNNINIFADRYRKSKTIIIPQVYKEYTVFDNRLIVMDFLQGKSLYQLNEEEMTMYSSVFNIYVLNALMVKKLIHCDVHAGNLIFMYVDGKYKLGLIDFGIIKEMNDLEYRFMYKLLVNLMNKEYENFYKEILDNSIENRREIDNKIFDEIIYKVMQEHKNGNLLKDGMLRNSDLDIIFTLLHGYELNIKKDVCELLLSLICIFNILNVFLKDRPLGDLFKSFIIPDKLLC